MCVKHTSKVGALQLSGVRHHEGSEAARVWLLGGVAEEPRPSKPTGGRTERLA